MVGAVCTPTFIAVPVVTIWAGVFPIVLNFWAAIALTVYYISTSSVRISSRQIWFQIIKCDSLSRASPSNPSLLLRRPSHCLLSAPCSCSWR